MLKTWEISPFTFICEFGVQNRKPQPVLTPSAALTGFLFASSHSVPAHWEVAPCGKSAKTGFHYMKFPSFWDKFLLGFDSPLVSSDCCWVSSVYLLQVWSDESYLLLLDARVDLLHASLFHSVWQNVSSKSLQKVFRHRPPFLMCAPG